MGKNLTIEQVNGIIELILTDILVDNYPLSRQTIRSHVRSALTTLDDGLVLDTLLEISGALNETIVYSVNAP